MSLIPNFSFNRLLIIFHLTNFLSCSCRFFGLTKNIPRNPEAVKTPRITEIAPKTWNAVTGVPTANEIIIVTTGTKLKNKEVFPAPSSFIP
jgi:hypothetical protein